MAFPQSFLDELLARNDIVDVVGSYVQLTRKGSNLFGLCFANQDQVDGMGAFVNKGKATFTGKALAK